MELKKIKEKCLLGKNHNYLMDDNNFIEYSTPASHCTYKFFITISDSTG